MPVRQAEDQTRVRPDDVYVIPPNRALTIAGGVLRLAPLADAHRFSIEVLPKIFEQKDARNAVRIWVPGCATGEEAYTLAVLAVEQRDALRAPIGIQIFGTDIDEAALRTASQAAFPEGVARQISPERLERFFVKKGPSITPPRAPSPGSRPAAARPASRAPGRPPRKRRSRPCRGSGLPTACLRKYAHPRRAGSWRESMPSARPRATIENRDHPQPPRVVSVSSGRLSSPCLRGPLQPPRFPSVSGAWAHAFAPKELNLSRPNGHGPKRFGGRSRRPPRPQAERRHNPPVPLNAEGIPAAVPNAPKPSRIVLVSAESRARYPWLPARVIAGSVWRGPANERVRVDETGSAVAAHALAR